MAYVLINNLFEIVTKIIKRIFKSTKFLSMMTLQNNYLY